MMLRQNAKKALLGLSSQRNFSPIPLASRLYHSNVIDHYENPRNVGSFDKNDPNVGTGLVGAPSCGDVMKLQVKIDGSGQITDARFKTFGCGSAIAASSLGMLICSSRPFQIFCLLKVYLMCCISINYNCFINRECVDALLWFMIDFFF